MPSRSQKLKGKNKGQRQKLDDVPSAYRLEREVEKKKKKKKKE